MQLENRLHSQHTVTCPCKQHRDVPCLALQLCEAIGGRDVFRSNACHDMLTEHSKEVRGATLPNFVGDRVFNGIFAERKWRPPNAPTTCVDLNARLSQLLLLDTVVALQHDIWSVSAPVYLVTTWHVLAVHPRGLMTCAGVSSAMAYAALDCCSATSGRALKRPNQGFLCSMS